MAKLTTAARKKIPTSKFALPEKRAYPITNRAHAANAKSRATQMLNKGKLTPAEKKRIDAKANKLLGKKTKAKAK